MIDSSSFYAEKIVVKPETDKDAYYLGRLTDAETEELERYITEVFKDTTEERMWGAFRGISIYMEKVQIPLTTS